MNWSAADPSKEWKSFYLHQCEFKLGGPLSKCSEKEKICNLIPSFVGDKARETHFTLQWKTVQVRCGESAQNESLVQSKFTARLEAKKNPIKGAKSRYLGDFSTDQIVIELTRISK